MYIPPNAKTAKTNRFLPQRSKHSRYGIPLALFVVALGAAWALWQDQQAPGEQTRAELLVAHDLQALWSWSDKELIGGAEAADWTVRFDVTAKAGTFEELQQKLFTDEKGNSEDKLVENEGRTVTGKLPVYGGRISISRIEAEDNRERLMLLLEMSRKEQHDPGKVLEATAALSEQIAQLAPAFTSSMKVQGKTHNEQAIDDLAKLAQAGRVDQYRDGGTTSETFYTGKLYSAITAGGGKSANLQIAVHEDKNNGNTDLTIGIPVITGEYSAFTRE